MKWNDASCYSPARYICQNDPTKREFMNKKSKFWISKDAQPWTVATAQCQALNSSLISIENEYANTRLVYATMKFEGQVFWTGGNDRNYEGVWMWGNG